MKQILDIVRAAPVVGTIVDVFATFATAVRTAFQSHSGAGPFLADDDALVKSVKCFSAGLFIYWFIAGTFIYWSTEAGSLDSYLSSFNQGKWKANLVLALHYAVFVASVYYILSAAKLEILNPFGAVVIGFYGAGFILPLRAVNEMVIGSVMLSYLEGSLGTGSHDNLNTMQSNVLFISMLLIIPILFILYFLFFKWLRTYYNVSSLVMLIVVICAALVSGFAAAWLMGAIFSLPANLEALMSFLL